MRRPLHYFLLGLCTALSMIAMDKKRSLDEPLSPEAKNVRYEWHDFLNENVINKNALENNASQISPKRTFNFVSYKYQNSIPENYCITLITPTIKKVALIISPHMSLEQLITIFKNNIKEKDSYLWDNCVFFHNNQMLIGNERTKKNQVRDLYITNEPFIAHYVLSKYLDFKQFPYYCCVRIKNPSTCRTYLYVPLNAESTRQDLYQACFDSFYSHIEKTNYFLNRNDVLSEFKVMWNDNDLVSYNEKTLQEIGFFKDEPILKIECSEKYRYHKKTTSKDN